MSLFHASQAPLVVSLKASNRAFSQKEFSTERRYSENFSGNRIADVGYFDVTTKSGYLIFATVVFSFFSE